MNKTVTETKYRRGIVIISLLVPAVVMLLIYAPWKSEPGASWIYALPHLNAVINSITTLLLIAAFIFIRQGNIQMHKTLMLMSFALGCLFLVSYITYHASAPSTVYGDVNGDGALDEAEKMAAGSSRSIYLIVLLTHIVLAIGVAPLVLFALYHGLRGSFDSHRKIVKFAYPVWLYVSVSGVVVYWLIRPFY